MPQNPLFLQSTAETTFEHPASDFRVFLSELVTPGVSASPFGQLVVSPGGRLTVSVSPGRAAVAGTAVAGQGTYYVLFPSGGGATISAPQSAGTRIDRIVVRVLDAQADGGASTAQQILAIKGTVSPSGVPTPPDMLPSTLLLAEVTVRAGVSSIDASDIVDKRVILGARSINVIASAPYGTVLDRNRQLDPPRPGNIWAVSGRNTLQLYGNDGWQDVNRTETQVFTQDGTWNKPKNAKTVKFVAISAGGAGFTAGGQGSGGPGPGGGRGEMTLDASAVPDSVYMNVAPTTQPIPGRMAPGATSTVSGILSVTRLGPVHDRSRVGAGGEVGTASNGGGAVITNSAFGGGAGAFADNGAGRGGDSGLLLGGVCAPGGNGPIQDPGPGRSRSGSGYGGSGGGAGVTAGGDGGIPGGGGGHSWVHQTDHRRQGSGGRGEIIVTVTF